MKTGAAANNVEVLQWRKGIPGQRKAAQGGDPCSGRTVGLDPTMTPRLTITPSREQFVDLAKSANLIPVVAELIADIETPVSAFAKLRQSRGGCFLFESAERNEESGRFSFIGLDPLAIFSFDGRVISITREGETSTSNVTTDPLTHLQELLAEFRFAPRTDVQHFVAGAVGYIGYDVVRFFEPRVPINPRDDLELPEMQFIIARTIVVFDHRYRRVRVVVNAFVADDEDAGEVYDGALRALRKVRQSLAQPIALSHIDAAAGDTLPKTTSNITRSDFEQKVTQAKELIANGDIFQVVLSQRFETRFDGDALDLYRALRFANPSPYMFLLEFGDDLAFVGSSPEMHVRVRDRVAELRPIAGTRTRGSTPAEDDRNARELLADPKELAEHVMLIDLARNDLGRIAKIGTVKVTEQMTIERYSHVMHIVSHVVSELRDGVTAFDALRATFPAGTVSGAPKIRAMQIIAEIEKSRRGFYSGVVGYFGLDGSLDSCIALRSVVLKNGRAYVQAGAGIVADSDPAREYEETVNKAKAVLAAIASTPSS